jgi:hypothetical protein
MEFRREMIGEQTYTLGVESLADQPQSARVAGWIMKFLKA